MSDKVAKRRKLLQALLSGDYLSKQDCLKKFRLWNVGGAVFSLRQEGWPIQTRMVEKRNERFAQYYIERTA